ncbi:MAG: hypothetical protein GXP33_01425 [Spirochaetes bacterium]|nr:hypothetical protein [Spirochaetota bacterium]
MKKTCCPAVILIFSLLVISSVAADEMVLDYLEGDMQIKRDGAWVTAEIGDIFVPETLLKLSGNSIAEISGNGTSLTITKNGIYSVKDILKKKRRVLSSGLALAFKNFYRIFRGTSKQVSGTAMGVRGAKVGDASDGVDWVSEDDEYIKKGKDLIKDGSFAEAVSVLKDGLDAAEDSETEEECLYLIGYANAMLGHNAMALTYLSKVEVDESKSYFDDLVLIKGQLMVDSLDFSGALKLFNYYLNNYPDGLNTQVINFLSGICYRELNKKDEALISLNKAVKIDPSTDIGMAADKEIRRLK